MKSLFKITEEFIELNNKLIESEGVIDEETDKLLYINKEELEIKSFNYVYVIKQNEAIIEKAKQEIERLSRIKKSLENANSRLENSIETAMNIYEINEIKTDLTKINFRKSESVEIEDDTLIPNEYIIWDKKIEKNKIKKAIKDGIEVPGIKIITNKNLQIK